VLIPARDRAGASRGALVASLDRASADENDQRGESTKVTPGKILIVDDDPSFLRTTSLALQRQGYLPVTVGTGTAALAAVETERPSLVILDVLLPDMSGIDVCKRLRSSAASASLPILMLSAMGEVQSKVIGIKAGADDYLAKPVDLAELGARVERLLIRAAQVAQRSPGAQLVACIGAKGGVGTSTVAVNVGVALTQLGKAVVLADLRHWFGSVGLMLGLQPERGLSELGDLDAESLQPRDIERRLVTHSTGLQVLCNGVTTVAEHEHPLSSAHVRAVLEGVSSLADWVMVDLAADVGPIDEQVLSRCDAVALVTEPDSLALACARGKLGILQRCGVPKGLVGVVAVHRSPATSITSVESLHQVLDAAIVGLVPLASESCLAAARRGVPIVLAEPDDPAARALHDLAQRMA